MFMVERNDRKEDMIVCCCLGFMVGYSLTKPIYIHIYQIYMICKWLLCA